MAIYHLSAKPVQRSKGRSVVAAIAYRAGCVILDKRTGIKHDYTKKYKSGGIVHSEIVVPDGIVIPSRDDLWNWAELSEKRKDACTGREYEVNLPYELSDQQRISLTQNFSKLISNQFGVAVDFSIHKPTQKDIKDGADPRNYHAHIMTTTRKITNDGLTEKADIEKAGRKRKLDLENTRKLWADTTNQFLEMAGLEQRIDHRSLEAQGVNRKPTIKMGWESMAAERAGYKTVKGDINRAIQADNEQLAQFEADLKLLRHQAELEQAKEAKRQADEVFEKQVYEMLGAMLKQSEQRRQEKLRLEREQQEQERQEQLRLEIEHQEKQRKAYEQRITRLTRQTGRADKAIARSKPRITATKQRIDGTEQASAGTISDTRRYSGRLSQLRLHCERIKRVVNSTERTIERASQIIGGTKRFIDQTQSTINGTNQEIKQLEQQRQEKQRKANEQQRIAEFNKQTERTDTAIARSKQRIDEQLSEIKRAAELIERATQLIKQVKELVFKDIGRKFLKYATAAERAPKNEYKDYQLAADELLKVYKPLSGDEVKRRFEACYYNNETQLAMPTNRQNTPLFSVYSCGLISVNTYELRDLTKTYCKRTYFELADIADVRFHGSELSFKKINVDLNIESLDKYGLQTAFEESKRCKLNPLPPAELKPQPSQTNQPRTGSSNERTNSRDDGPSFNF